MQTFFLHKTISNKMFYSDYKYITDKLPDSLVKRAYQSLLNHSKNSVILEIISGKFDQIELYLRHKLEVYKNLLNRKRKNIAQEKYCILETNQNVMYFQYYHIYMLQIVKSKLINLPVIMRKKTIGGL